jgi:hypothetical protein
VIFRSEIESVRSSVPMPETSWPSSRRRHATSIAASGVANQPAIGVVSLYWTCHSIIEMVVSRARYDKPRNILTLTEPPNLVYPNGAQKPVSVRGRLDASSNLRKPSMSHIPENLVSPLLRIYLLLPKSENVIHERQRGRAV